jgi:hypothetical protein
LGERDPFQFLVSTKKKRKSLAYYAIAVADKEEGEWGE